jgi:hypothetical protein
MARSFGIQGRRSDLRGAVVLRHRVSFFSSVATSAAMDELLADHIDGLTMLRCRRTHPRATSARSGLKSYVRLRGEAGVQSGPAHLTQATYTALRAAPHG